MQVNERRREMQQEAISHLEKSDYNGFAILPTGLGKGWILVECLRRINPTGRVWYLCDSEDNRDVTFKEELKKWGAEEWIPKIEFMCYQTACRLSGQEVELILGDEVDFGLTPVYVKSITENPAKHRVLVSATLAGEKREVAEQIAPIVFEKYLKEIEDARILNGARHYLVNYLLSPAENTQYLKYNRSFKNLLNGSRDKGRLEMLQIQRKQFLSSLTSSKNICRKLLKVLYAEPTNKVLIFCGLSDQADQICKYSYHSKSEENFLADFDKGIIRVLSVVAKADRGLNLTGVNNIIFESPTRSITKMTQRSGRGRRLQQHEILDIYYLVPYFKSERGDIRPTVVLDWVRQATEKMNFNPIIYQFDD